MNERLKRYIDGLFSSYDESMGQIKELKEEMLVDLEDRIEDLKKEGYEEDAAYEKAVKSIGDLSEILETIEDKTRELQEHISMNLSRSALEFSDFKDVKMTNGNFKYSNLRGSDFSGADLTGSVFNRSNLENANFDGANLSNATFNRANLKGASMKGTTLDGTNFKYSELSGISFEGQKLVGTNFDYAGLRNTSFKNTELVNVSFRTNVKKANFDGAAMDKITFAILKGYKADLRNVTVK